MQLYRELQHISVSRDVHLTNHVSTYVAVSVYNVDYAAQHYDEIQYIPRVTEVILLNIHKSSDAIRPLAKLMLVHARAGLVYRHRTNIKYQYLPSSSYML